MASWKIGSRAGTCARCERAFEDGERHVSTLVFNAEAELWREDLCPGCWTPPAEEGEAQPGGADAAARADAPQASPGDAPGEAPGEAGPGEAPGKAPEKAPGGASGEAAPRSLFWWFTRHRVEKKKTLQLDLAALEQIFISLEGREEEPVRELRYLLCLILMRKRRVKLEKLERSAEGESFLVKRPRREERFRVFVFDFSPDRLDELRAQLQALFDGADLEDGIQLPGPEGDAGASEVSGASGSEEPAAGPPADDAEAEPADADADTESRRDGDPNGTPDDAEAVTS